MGSDWKITTGRAGAEPSVSPASADGQHLSRPLRAWVVGVAGAGKTELAMRLSSTLGAHHVELDDLFWLPGWKVREEEDFLRVVGESLQEDNWVADGQYPAAVQAYLDRADVLVWVDPPFLMSYLRLARRTFSRLLRHEMFCGSNYESVGSVFGRKSMLWLALRCHRDQRRKIRAMCDKSAKSGALQIHVRGAALKKLMSHPEAVLRFYC